MTAASRPHGSIRARLAAPLAGLAGVAVSWPCLRLGWVDYDEGYYARGNLYLRDLADLGILLTRPGPGYQFQPTTYLSHALDYAVFGDSLVWFHAVNVLLYALCCALVARLGQALLVDWGWGRGRAARAGFFAGLAFAVHPVHVECYAWLGDRKDLLACAFGLGSYAVYRRLPGVASSRRRVLGQLLAGALLWAALGAKLSAAPLGGCLALEGLLRAPGGWVARLRAALRWSAPALLLGVAFSLVWYLLQLRYPVPLARPGMGHGVLERGLYVLRSYGHYVRLLGWPLDLAVHYYPRPRVAEVLPNLLWLVAGGVGTALAARRPAQRPLVLWAAGWFAMGLVLVANVVPLGYVNDRYLLLPSAGVAVAFGGWVARGRRRRLVGALLLVAVWAALSGAQIPVWSSARALWTQALRVDPRHPFALGKLGLMDLAEGRIEEAERRAELARAQAPDADFPVLLKAEVLDARGQRAEAEALLMAQAEASHEITPLLHLGNRALAWGDIAAADGFARRALEQAPRSLEALRLGAECALRLGEPRRALQLCRRGLEIAAPPGLTLVAARSAVASGAWELAARYVALYERSGPDWESQLLGAQVAFAAGDSDALALRLDACVEQVPRSLPVAVSELVGLLERCGRGEQALRVLREADPLPAGLRLARAHFEAILGDSDAARVDLDAALEESPELRQRAASDPALRDWVQ